VQSLPTEAKPLTACSQCGTALPAPSGTATFVYGVGAVGYQSCDTCGAKWRYLWQDPPGAGGGLNRLPFLLVGAAIIVVLGLGAFALLRSPTPYRPTAAAAATTTPPSHRSTTSTPPSTSTSIDDPAASNGSDLVRILAPVDAARPPFVQYLQTSAVSDQQYDVSQRAAEFVAVAQPSVDGLRRAQWPASASADVDKLVDASQQFISDVDQIQYGLLYSASFADKLTTDVATIQQYEGLARKDLGLSAT
jgi:hypothetical protein